MVDGEIRRILESDVRDTFECGNPGVDRFFREHVYVNEFKRRACATYVVVVDGNRIVSFATIAPSSIPVANLGKLGRGMPRYDQPVLKLAQFGTDLASRGKRYGEQLMFKVFACAHALSLDYGCIGIVLDAVPDTVSYYHRFGFGSIAAPATPSGTTQMFLPLRKIPQ